MSISYSIIIPHKNTPRLLQYCLDSIPVRDDVEVIVVDDDSSPDKVDFEHFPRWKGERFEAIFTKEGKGAGYVRNIGLEHAKGVWVLFVDSDDFFLPSIGAVLDEERDTDADLVFYRPKAVLLEDRMSRSNRADCYNSMIDEYFLSHDDIPLRCRWFPPWSKLYRKKLIQDNGILFDEIRFSNDSLFSVKAGICANRVVIRDQSFYCISESGNSLTSSFLQKPGELQIRADAFFRVQQLIHESGYPVDDKFASFYLRLLFSDERDGFFRYFELMRKMGFKKSRMIREIFMNNKAVSRMKRSVYVFLKTTF